MSKKKKFNLALIVKDERLYGFDSEGGYYHEHPCESPETHLKMKNLEEFVIESLKILKEKKLL